MMVSVLCAKWGRSGGRSARPRPGRAPATNGRAEAGRSEGLANAELRCPEQANRRRSRGFAGPPTPPTTGPKLRHVQGQRFALVEGPSLQVQRGCLSRARRAV
ncbi:hypothetical protein H8959_005405 [Pygathrix nigripes]